MIVEHDRVVWLDLGDDLRGVVDLLDRDVEMAPRRLALFLDALLERLRLFVEARVEVSRASKGFVSRSSRATRSENIATRSTSSATTTGS
ncbi:MAG TPA: hypothetical protein VL326_03465 [Kofleriaceae bacterium]|nr:hypothetical protein [Kofleriaceae bacterium]